MGTSKALINRASKDTGYIVVKKLDVVKVTEAQTADLQIGQQTEQKNSQHGIDLVKFTSLTKYVSNCTNTHTHTHAKHLYKQARSMKLDKGLHIFP